MQNRSWQTIICHIPSFDHEAFVYACFPQWLTQLDDLVQLHLGKTAEIARNEWWYEVMGCHWGIIPMAQDLGISWMIWQQITVKWEDPSWICPNKHEIRNGCFEPRHLLIQALLFPGNGWEPPFLFFWELGKFLTSKASFFSPQSGIIIYK